MPPMQREQGDTRKDGAGGGGGYHRMPLDKILVFKSSQEPAFLRFLFSVPANWCKNWHILLSIF
jgi:hypothetical protein